MGMSGAAAEADWLATGDAVPPRAELTDGAIGLESSLESFGDDDGENDADGGDG